MEDAWERRSGSPVKVGERLRVRVDGVGSKGDLYARHRELIIFIKGESKCVVGEAVDIEIVDVKENCAFAKRLKPEHS
jgi:predicted RNA-binding protein with TRAM domain